MIAKQPVKRDQDVDGGRDRESAVTVAARGAGRWVVGSWWRDLVVIAFITVVAAVLRLRDLAGTPPGLHGDEAIVGLEARRIIEDGWIGPYTPSALGQPTGPLYATAVSLRLFGESVFAVRVVSAVAGTLTVVALFAVLRRHVGSAQAVAGAALLAIMGWHLHFSRIGFPLAMWPLVVVVAVGAMLEAVRRGRPVWWALAGAAAAAGIYVYNAHLLVLAALTGFALVTLGGWLLPAVVAAIGLAVVLPHPATLGGLGVAIVALLASPRLAEPRRFAALLAFAGGLGLGLLPMARFAADERTGYFEHLRSASLFGSNEWLALTTNVERAWFVLGRYLAYWDRLCCHPRLDGVDGTGITPIVPLMLLLLAGVGLLIGFRRRHEPSVILAGLLVVVLPVGAVLTVEGLARRTFALAVVLAALAGFAIVELARAAWQAGVGARLASAVALLAVVGWSGYQGLRDELQVFPASPQAAWVFARDLTAAAEFMASLPPEAQVLFYADRWSVDYETVQFLAPGVSAEDRSREFGRFRLGINGDRGQPVFVLVGQYRELLPELAARYPGGEVVTAGPSDDPFFVAYLPAGDDPLAGGPAIAIASRSGSR